MLHFFPPGMAERYALFTFLAVLGVLQLIAARYRWEGFSILGRQRRRWGYVIGVVLLGGAYLWFFGTSQVLIFQPGLAGAELFTVFSVSTLSSVAATLGLASVLRRSATARPGPGEGQVNLPPGRGTVLGTAGPGQAPAVVVVSDLPDGDFPLSPVTDQLVNRGVLVLSIDLVGGGPIEYPEVLARVPAAIAYLQDRPDVDGRGIALIGVGIGGDLALRAAATDQAIRGVIAVDPVLSPEATGLDALRYATFGPALRWGGLRRRLAAALAAAERLPQLGERPALLLFRSNTMPITEDVAGVVKIAVEEADDKAVQRIVQWSTEVLGEYDRVA